MAISIQIPENVESLNTDFLTQVVQTVHPKVRVADFSIADRKRYGGGEVSTSERLILELDYEPGAPETILRRALVKLKIDEFPLGELYDNEVNFYTRVRPQLSTAIGIEVPEVLGGICDRATSDYFLLIEDLGQRNARFPSVSTRLTLEEVRAVLSQLSKLHAAYWQSPRLKGDLAWYQVHGQGSLAEFFRKIIPPMCAAEAEAHPFKQNCVEKLGTTLAELNKGYQALHHYQTHSLPQTLLHGDAHVGNTYFLPDGTAGLLDFQLTSCGAYVHDVNDLIISALDVEQRRAHEADLLAFYLDALAEEGVNEPPTFGDAMTEYRRGILWGFYASWMATPVANYGETITRENLERFATAFEDHDTLSLIREIL